MAMLIELQLRPSERKLRQFGWVAAGAFSLLAVLGFGHGGLASVVFAALAALSLLFSFLWPAGNRPLFVAMSLVSYPIGLIVSHLVLTFLFFAILTPVGLLFRLFGRDPLSRRFEPEKASYWLDLPRVTRNEDYFRQF